MPTAKRTNKGLIAQLRAVRQTLGSSAVVEDGASAAWFDRRRTRLGMEVLN